MKIIYLKYDYFIINRSDCYHTRKIDLSKYKRVLSNSVILPYGEHYGGLPDRFAIVGKKYIYKWLNLLHESTVNPLCISPEIATYLNSKRKKIRIYYIPYSFYTVRNNYDKTRWQYRRYNENTKHIVKYNSEYELTNKKVSRGFYFKINIFTLIYSYRRKIMFGFLTIIIIKVVVAYI